MVTYICAILIITLTYYGIVCLKDETPHCDASVSNILLL